MAKEASRQMTLCLIEEELYEETRKREEGLKVREANKICDEYLFLILGMVGLVIVYQKLSYVRDLIGEGMFYCFQLFFKGILNLLDNPFTDIYGIYKNERNLEMMYKTEKELLESRREDEEKAEEECKTIE